MNASGARGSADPPNLPSVIGEFCLETERYLILAIVVDAFRNSKPLIGRVNEASTEDLNELVRFKINGYSCAIVKDTQRSDQERLDLTALLSGRELQIAVLVSQGYANKQIALRLHISEWTVASYLRRIFAKLGVDSRAAMAYQCAPLIQRMRHLSPQYPS